MITIRYAGLVALAMMTAALTACGMAHTSVTTPASNLTAVKQVALRPVQVSSAEQNADAAALNEEFRQMALSELQSLMASKGIVTSPTADSKVGCNIDVTYGNRALRYFVGFGAGAGHVKIHTEMTDGSGAVRYATNTEADLAVGGFGGDMSSVVRDAVRDAMKEFSAGF